MGIISNVVINASAALVFTTASFAQEAPTRDTVIAIVNGTEITLGHVVSLASRLPERYLGADDKDLYAGIVDQLIQQELLKNLVSEESAELKLAIENEKRALIAGKAIEGIYADAINEAAVQEQYKNVYENADPVLEYHASHILLDTEKEATAVVELIRAGSDFVQTAKDKSTGPSGPSGGDLGWAGAGQFVPEFEAAMVQLKPDEVSEPVKTQFGWHVIRLNEIREKPAPALATVQGEIEDALQAAALKDKISELEASGKIEKKDQNIDKSLVKNFELLGD